MSTTNPLDIIKRLDVKEKCIMRNYKVEITVGEFCDLCATGMRVTVYDTKTGQDIYSGLNYKIPSDIETMIVDSYQVTADDFYINV